MDPGEKQLIIPLFLRYQIGNMEILLINKLK